MGAPEIPANKSEPEPPTPHLALTPFQYGEAMFKMRCLASRTYPMPGEVCSLLIETLRRGGMSEYADAAGLALVKRMPSRGFKFLFDFGPWVVCLALLASRLLDSPIPLALIPIGMGALILIRRLAIRRIRKSREGNRS